MPILPAGRWPSPSGRGFCNARTPCASSRGPPASRPRACRYSPPVPPARPPGSAARPPAAFPEPSLPHVLMPSCSSPPHPPTHPFPAEPLLTSLVACENFWNSRSEARLSCSAWTMTGWYWSASFPACSESAKACADPRIVQLKRCKASHVSDESMLRMWRANQNSESLTWSFCAETAARSV